jgi:hypothetical protein
MDQQPRNGNNMKNKLRMIIAALALCAANAFAIGAGGLFIATSEALEKEIVLWSMVCMSDSGRHAPSDVRQECANDQRTLVKRLVEFAKFADEAIADPAGAGKLQARAARFYVKYLGGSKDKAEAAAIVSERTRILAAKPDSTFAKVGLLSDDSIEWLKGE